MEDVLWVAIIGRKGFEFKKKKNPLRIFCKIGIFFQIAKNRQKSEFHNLKNGILEFCRTGTI